MMFILLNKAWVAVCNVELRNDDKDRKSISENSRTSFMFGALNFVSSYKHFSLISVKYGIPL